MSEQKKTTPANDSSGFQQQLGELERIVDWFESGEMEDVEEALETFKRGMELARELEKRLQEAENTVQEITQGFDQDSFGEADTDEADTDEESA
ncbi:exodeoxyribonuclease VII small subunit [Candidatus Saccharibacteria bacterium QS_5_54_17]|nr:MAG: exodeoxyribonuclease VII small subunit [Candidatus Saccharibacteria bacterium QS_5_54_17]